MEKPAQNIQDSFLNNARKDKIVLTIYLMSGVKLSGRIKSFDKYSLVLETNNQEQLIFKHAISTVVTQKSSHSYGSSSSSQAASQSTSGATRPGCRCTRIPRRLRTRHTRNPVQERAILVGLEWKSRGSGPLAKARASEVEESLDELAELAASAGAAITERIVQSRVPPKPPPWWVTAKWRRSPRRSNPTGPTW